jgi:hypothetical protein
MPAEDFRRWNEENGRWTGGRERAAREAWLAAERRLLSPDGRPLPEGRPGGFRVRFEQHFLYGPGDGRHGVAVREAQLPFPPSVGMLVDFSEEHYPRVESVFWSVGTQSFTCVLTGDSIHWETVEQALAYYGGGWRLDD